MINKQYDYYKKKFKNHQSLKIINTNFMYFIICVEAVPRKRESNIHLKYKRPGQILTRFTLISFQIFNKD